MCVVVCPVLVAGTVAGRVLEALVARFCEPPQAPRTTTSSTTQACLRLTRTSIVADKEIQEIGVMVRPKAKRLVEYDGLRHRVWILGRRCHHGATGSVVATVAFLGLAIAPASEARQLGGPRSMLALAAAGGALMLHDWKDRSLWFARQPGLRTAAA